MPCKPIYCPTSELYRYDGIPLRRHVDHSIPIDIGQLHWQLLMKRYNNSTADRYPLLNRKSRRKYTVLIKFDIGILMLARTMSHWYRLDADPLSRRWNSVVETTSTIRYRIDHFTSPNLSYAIFISLRYSDRHRIDIDLMQFWDLGEILWYGKLFWYEYIMGL